jgi:hypothetical protein
MPSWWVDVVGLEVSNMDPVRRGHGPAELGGPGDVERDGDVAVAEALHDRLRARAE